MSAGPVLDLMATLREAMKPQPIFTSGGAGLLYCILCKKTFHWGGPATNHAKGHEARGEAHWRMSGISGRDDEWFVGPRPTSGAPVAPPDPIVQLAELLRQMDAELFSAEQAAHPAAYKQMAVWLGEHDVAVRP